MAQYAVPWSDVQHVNWTFSTGTNAWPLIDDGATPVDTDFTTTPTVAATSTTVLVCGLTTVLDPGAGVTSGYILRVRAKKAAGSGAQQVAWSLLDGSNAIVSGITAASNITTSFADYTITLTSGQIAAVRTAFAASGFIGGWRIGISMTAFGGTGNNAAISNAHLEVPPGTTAYTQTLTASITPTTVRVAATGRTLATTFTPTAVRSAETGRTLATTTTLTTTRVASVGRTLAATISESATIRRAIAATKTAQLALTGARAAGTAAVRAAVISLAGLRTASRDRPQALAASLTTTATLARGVAARRAATLTLSASRSASVVYARTLAATITETAVISRSVAATRTATVTLTALRTGMAGRFQTLLATVTLVAAGRIEMGLDVLARMASGGTTVIRKLLYLFDD